MPSQRLRERAQRERVVRGVDADERDARKLQHAVPGAWARVTPIGGAAGACVGAGAVSVARVAAQRAANARNASTAKTTTSGARCSVARLTVVWSVTQSRALVKPKTTTRNSAAGRDDGGQRRERRRRKLPPREQRRDDRAVPEQVPVAEQEVRLAERPPRRVEVEVQLVVEDDRVGLREHGEREQRERRSRSPRPSVPGAAASATTTPGSERQRPDEAGHLDLRAGDGEQQREAGVARDRASRSSAGMPARRPA